MCSEQTVLVTLRIHLRSIARCLRLLLDIPCCGSAGKLIRVALYMVPYGKWFIRRTGCDGEPRGFKLAAEGASYE